MTVSDAPPVTPPGSLDASPVPSPGRVRKAVIPAAGLGTRCLPLTKALPKELLPVFDRPALEVIAGEATESGLDSLVLVTGWGKSAIENHFDRHPALEDKLARQPDLLDAVTRQTRNLSIISVRQGAPLGLGHAVGCARRAVGDEPFAVMLPDDLVLGPTPALRSLVRVFEQTGRGAVLLMEVPKEMISSKGIIAGTPRADGTILITDLIEKPRAEDAPSNWAVVGRYVFPPSIFPLIDASGSGAHGEIQLTDAMRLLAREEGLIGVPINGRWLDTGTPLGLMLANVEYAWAGSADARAALRELLGRLDQPERLGER